MAITGTKVYTCNDGTTYASEDEWIASHGHCGTAQPYLTSATLTLNPDGQSVTCTYVWEDQAAFDAWKASRIPSTRDYVETSKSEITSV
jgi:heme-degrading monooxygenase HmoA